MSKYKVGSWDEFHLNMNSHPTLKADLNNQNQPSRFCDQIQSSHFLSLIKTQF